MTAFVAGFALGISLIVAIGAQNAFVLRQGLRGQHVLAVILCCAVSDAILVTVGVVGAGSLAEARPGLVELMRWGGAAFLFVYGILAFSSAMGPAETLDPSENGGPALGVTIATCLALTWGNPHVYLDTVLLLGSVSTTWGPQAGMFGAGAVLASFVFFFALGYGARALRPFFAQPRSWRILDAAVGVIMWSVALGLILG